MSFSEVTAYLRRLRVEKGISQSELAAATGLSLRQISRWETGGSEKINSEALLRAVVYLDASFERIRGMLLGNETSEVSDVELAEAMELILRLRTDRQKLTELVEFGRKLMKE